MIHIWMFLACLSGFLIRELMAITSRRNSIPPSLTYYWSLPKNRWMFALNALCTVAVMLGRNELVSIASDPAFIEEWPKTARFAGVLRVAPIWTSLFIGLFSAFLIRWLITTIDQRFGRSKRIREGETSASQ